MVEDREIGGKTGSDDWRSREGWPHCSEQEL